MHQQQKGFVLAFVIAVIAGLSVMTTAMFFYYDNDLKSVSRNSVMQQVTLAAETGLQEGQKYIEDRLNTNSFELVDIKNSLKVVQSDNKCLNRHGFTDSTKDVFYAKRISQTLTNNASGDDRKFAGMSYEVFIQRHADVVRSLYFSGQGPSNKQNQNTNYEIRSFAMVEPFYDFPDRRFTIEWWMKDKNAFSNRDTQIWEWGRRRDLVFKIKNDKWNPRMNQTLLVRDGETVGVPIKNEWVHLAMVWDGGDKRTEDRDNVRIYQNGVLQGTYSIDVVSRKTSKWRNPPEQLLGKDTTFIFGEGFDGYSGRGMTGKRKMSSIPFVGHVAEMRLWNVSRTQQDIADNMNKRITGSEPGLVSYYKFNEGSGNTAKDFSTTRSIDKKNDARIYGLENVGTRWALELAKYVVVADTGSSPPVQRFPPGEDITYYKIMSCGIGPQGQLVPLELMVSAPGQKGDVGDGKVALTEEDLASLTGEDGTSKVISLSKYIAQTGVAGDIKIPDSNNTNTGFDAFKRSMEQCNNASTYSDFSTASTYQEGDCVIFENKTYILEKDEGVSSGNNFNIDDWQEILGSGCDGVQFVKGGDGSHRHYYKYFATAPDLSSDVGYDKDSVDWFEAKRRAERSTCGGMRGYLVSIDSAAENEFIRQAVMCNNSTSSGCIGAKPFHVQAGKTRGQYYGNRMDQTSDQHYIWLGNSDFRTPGTMRSESGPNIGQVNNYTNWQSGEPNNISGEEYADMEINRSNRVNGKWNDLRRIPGCYTNALDCITGYVVEYGGFDSFRLNHDDANDKKDVNDNTKFCVARATIEKDKYVSAEDVLKYNTQAEDYESTIVPASTTTDDSNTSDEWPGWNQNTGVLTLEHSSKPTAWSPTSNYSTGNFVWYNNRVWKALKNITGGSSLTPGNTPTIYNISAWELYSGNETDAPCAAVSTWMNAFESIQYFNKNEVTDGDEVNPFANEAGGTNENTESSASATLGERVILFTLGPLHVNKHLDGFNHFYEFYQFPVSTSGKAYNNRNTRYSEGYKVANRLHYFAKTGYLATITSEAENEVVAEKAKGNGWLGGLAQSLNQNTTANLGKCGGPMNRTSQATAVEDWRALKNVDTMPIYTRGANYNANTRLMNLIPFLQGETNINISSITKANPAVVTTASNHGLADDDIIRIQDISSSRLGVESTDGTIWGLTTGFYRVRVTSGTTFTLHHFVTRTNINSSGFTGDYPGDARLTTVEGIQHEYYRVSSSITNANQNISAQANLSLFFKDPPLNYFISQSSYVNQGTSTNADCPHWRWITGPEQFIWNNRGLAFAYKRVLSENPSPNQNSVNASWTRSSTTGGPSGQQVGEKFKNNMPYRNFSNWQPDNSLGSEWSLHSLGPQFGNAAQQWNDLHNWSGPNIHTNAWGVKGLVVEYGGMENYGDPITRISTKRVIKLFDRRVTKAVVSIKTGAQAGDMLVVGEEELTNLSLSVSGNNSQTVTITGDGSCQNYVDIIQSMIFTQSGASPGVREISVKLGDVTKPTDSNYYYRYISNSLSYEQANFQASYQNLCGLQGYLAMVTSTNDLAAISNVGLPQDEKIWINGTDECEGGVYRSGFWRYTSGPLEDREFWRTRINSTANIESESACDETALRSSSPNVKVGPFEGNNWLTGHPTANNNNYLAYQHPSSVSNRKIFTRNGNASSEVGGFLVQFGGSVGDFTGADIEEDGNMIDVGVGPIRAEMSFCTDGSQNSIYMEDEDSVDIEGLSSGWSKTSSFTSNTSPLTITPPSDKVTSIKDWGRELAKGFYQNTQTSNFTPGNRSIKIKLVYADPGLNEEICVLKTIGSRNRVVVNPVSWNNR